MRRRTLGIFAVIVLSFGCSGSNSESETKYADKTLPHVVFITLDTTRADRLGAYGYAQAHTENMDALAASGRLYTRAYSPLPLTIPAHISLFTGLYPPNHGVRTNGAGQMGPELLSMVERFQDAGYHTAASVAAFVTTREWGFNQGFDAFFDDIQSGHRNFWRGERVGEVVVNDILDWKQRQVSFEPVFIWVHLYDPHFPYVAPPQWLAEAEGRVYDAELAYMDDQIGRLVQAFQGEPTIFVLVGDHGEGLGDHGESTHGLFIYDSTQRVPWIVSGFGVTKEVIDVPVSLVDVAPTLLDLVGLDPLPKIDGIANPTEGGRSIYMESYQLAQRFQLAPHVGIVQDQSKLISLPQAELYDVVVDGGELENVASDHRELVHGLKQQLAEWNYGPPTEDAAHPMDPDVVSRLAALGYVDGGLSHGDPGTLPDPKEHKALIGKANHLERLLLEERLEEAEVMLRQLAIDYPHVAEFPNRLASILSRVGRPAEALEIFEESLANDPDNVIVRHAMAGLQSQMGQLREASQGFQWVAKKMPFSPRARAQAVATLADVPGAIQQAVDLGVAYLEAYPEDYALAGVLGVMLVERGMFDQALPLLENGLLADRPEFDVCYHLSAVAHGRGEIDRAKRLLEMELSYNPMNMRGRLALAKQLGLEKAWQEQVDLLEREGVPPKQNLELVYFHAQALFNLQKYTLSRERVDYAKAQLPLFSKILLLDANLLATEGKLPAAQVQFDEAKRQKAIETKESSKKKPSKSGS